MWGPHHGVTECSVYFYRLVAEGPKRSSGWYLDQDPLPHTILAVST